MSSDQPEVLVVDDRLGVRRGTELVLREAGLGISGVAGEIEQARSLLRRRRHDVALIEPSLRAGDGLALAAELLREQLDAPLVLYTDGPRIASAASLGARGLVLKSSPPQTLCDAVRRVAAGATFIDPEATGLVARSRVASLSPREGEILGLLADGLTGAQIAQRLFLSTETVRTHVRNATRKLGARTRTQAVVIAVCQAYS